MIFFQYIYALFIQVKAAKRASSGSAAERIIFQKKQAQLKRLEKQLHKLKIQETDREENKTIALGTSKLNYLDPRISVAWTMKHDVPIEKVSFMLNEDLNCFVWH